MRHWAAVGGLAVLIFASAEIALRVGGYKASGAAASGRLLWSYHRSNVYQSGCRSIVLIGASQMQAAIDLPAFDDRCPKHRVTQLAVNSHGSPMAVLRDLASDRQFKGIVLADVSAARFNGPRWMASQQSFVAHFRGAYSWYSPLECYLQWVTSSSSVVFNYNLIEKTRRVLRGRGSWWPAKAPVQFSFDRQIRLDLRSGNRTRELGTAPNGQPTEAIGPPVSGRFRDKLTQIESFVKQIRARGGAVVFLRMPTGGRPWRDSEKVSPRRVWWATFEKHVPSATFIHFKDVRAFGKYGCPDGLHLDQTDSPGFTRDLIDELESRKVL